MTNVIEQLTAAYERERTNGHPPVGKDDIPFTYEAVTDEWLTNVLCDRVPGARVVSHRLDVADDGNSNRRRIFVELNQAGSEAGLPSRIFCKASQRLANRISLGMAGAIQAEVNFYNHIRPQLDIETPVSLFANFNEALNSIIIMRDLGSGTIFCNHDTLITRERVEDQLQLLANYHGRFLESPELTGALSIFPTWQTFFGKLDYPDFERACDRGFAMAEEVIPPRLFARRSEIWKATRKSVARHTHLPHTLCHGDDHLRNWYITEQGKMGLNDWQVATRGHWTRDVVYAITTSLSVSDRRSWERELFSYYGDQLSRAAGRPIALEGSFDEARRQLMTVLAFWTVTLNPAPGMPDMQPRSSTLEFIKRIAVAVDDLESLDSFA